METLALQFNNRLIQLLIKGGDPNNNSDWIALTSCGQWGEDTMSYYDDNVKEFNGFGEITGDGLRLKMTGNSLALTIWEFQARYQ